MVNNGYLIHKNAHPMKGKVFRHKGMKYTVLDWYDRHTKRTFLSQYGEDQLTRGYRSMVMLEKALGNSLPVDEEVVLVASTMGVRAFHNTQIMKGTKHAKGTSVRSEER